MLVLRYLSRIFGALLRGLLLLVTGGVFRRGAGIPVPDGPLVTDVVYFQFAVYFLPRATTDPRTAVQQALQAHTQEFRPTLVNELDEAPTAAQLRATLEEDVPNAYPPLPREMMKYFAHGLSKEQAEQFMLAEEAMLLDFQHPGALALPALRAANSLVAEVAQATGGLVWDEETREVFSPEEWRARRLAHWSQALPCVSDHTTIHVYATGDYVRSVTLGMRKFGLPDVVVERSSRSLARNVGEIINLLCQRIVERGVLDAPGAITLRLADIQETRMRASISVAVPPEDSSETEADLNLWQAAPQDGDPNNRLMEITCEAYEGLDDVTRLGQMIARFFGKEDDVTYVEQDDAALQAASDRARAQLPALRKTFSAGLKPGEVLLLKCPFETPDAGREWMWVEVTAWERANLRGLLMNEPFHIPDLHAGQTVEVRQEDVFDYILRRDDGTQEGNETGNMLDNMPSRD